MKLNELILYNRLKKEENLQKMQLICENAGLGRETIFEVINQLISTAQEYGFEGNLWQAYLAFCIINDENSYSKTCEMAEFAEESLYTIALHDAMILKNLYSYDLSELEEIAGKDCIQVLKEYKIENSSIQFALGKQARRKINNIAVKLENTKDEKEFLDEITGFYKNYGSGKYGLHKAFRIEKKKDEVQIEPIRNIANVMLDDLVGYEIPKAKLIANTEAFVLGKKANNCLLFGDAGTGKSSSVKAILNQYYDKGLRIIEVYKHQFQDINQVIAQIKNRNYKFIIYMDDLSFEEFETEYKYLKAVIEGGIEKKPDNVLIYATSNRRHLIKEEFGDKEGRREDLHASDTVQEKLSLFERFGVSIFFIGPSKKEFQNIVLTLARRSGIWIPEEELFLEANKWELSHSGLSGRTAQQFIDYLLGQ